MNDNDKINFYKFYLKGRISSQIVFFFKLKVRGGTWKVEIKYIFTVKYQNLLIQHIY